MDMKEIIEKIKNNKVFRYVIVGVLLLVVVLILFSTFKSKNDKIQESNSDYVDNLESRLKSTLSKVDGVGKVSVVITVESGMETVLATKTVTTTSENGTNIEETPILVNGKTVVLKELYPKIIGVLIVAEGVDNIMILSKVQQATASLLDIKINQIEILSMN